MKTAFINYFISKKFPAGLCIFFLFFGYCLSGFSQDLIKLKSGKEIKANITQETTDIIKYTEYSDPKGPVYSVRKDQVESIKYRKGAKSAEAEKVNETLNDSTAIKQHQTSASGSPLLTVKKRYVYADGIKQSPRKVKAFMEDNPEAIKMYDSGRKMCNASNSCAFGVILTSLIATQIANGKEDDADARRVTAIGLGIDGAFIITAIVLSSAGKSKIRKSVSLYNSSLGKPITCNLDFGLQENGVGLALKF
jgi:hypothetical protein